MMALIWCFVTLLLFEQTCGNLVPYTYKDGARPNFFRDACDLRKKCSVKSTLLGGDRICYPEKYIPGGGVKKIEEIKAPQATLSKNFLGIIADASETSAQIESYMDVFGETFKFASKMAPILGAFSASFGFFGESPSAKDAVEAANKAIKELTSEINNRLENMALYVDQKILDSDRSWTVRKYEELSNKWADCMHLKVTIEDVNNCQRTAYDDIWAARAHFLKFHEKEGKSLSRDELKEVEVTFVAVRDYATLNLMVLKSLTDSYRAEKGVKARLYYKNFLKVTQENSKHLADYANWAFAEIMSFYDTQIKSSCQTSFKCGSITSKTDFRYSYCSCKMRPDVLDSQWCTNRVHVLIGYDHLSTSGYTVHRVDAHLNSNTVQKWFSKKALYALDGVYWKDMSNLVRTYWKRNVMDIVPLWLEIGNNAYVESVSAECEWKTGEGVSGDDAWSEQRFVITDQAACVNKCNKLRIYKNEDFNGVSFANFNCLCETKMTTRNNDSRYKSCIFPALEETRVRRDIEDYDAEVEEYFKPLFQY